MTSRGLFIIPALLIFSCSKDSVDCSNNAFQLEVVDSTPPTTCSSNDGKITLNITGTNSDVMYEVNTGSTIVRQRNPQFSNLFPGVLKISASSGACSVTSEFELRLSTKSGLSYQKDIQPILNARCNLSLCHDGSLGADRDWRSLEAIRKKLNNFQRVLSLNKMPPPPEDPLNGDQVVKILCWIADGALDN